MKLNITDRVRYKTTQVLDVAINYFPHISRFVLPPVLARAVGGTDYRSIPIATTEAAGGEPRYEYPLAGGAMHQSPLGVENIMQDVMKDNPQLTKLPDYMTEAFEKLIAEEMKNGGAGRFNRLARICEIAQHLAELFFMRVESVMELGPAAQHRAQYGAGRVGYNYYGGGLAQMNEGVAFGHGQALPNPADVARDEASNNHALHRSLRVRNLLDLESRADELGLDKAAITEQLKSAAELETTRAEITKQLEGGQDNVDLADSVDVRRHQGGLDGDEYVQGAGGARDGAGTEGAGRARQEEGVAARGGDVARGGNRVDSFDVGRIQALGQDAQARKEARERGDVQEREARGGERGDAQERSQGEGAQGHDCGRARSRVPSPNILASTPACD